MSASKNKNSVWERLKGIFKARPVAPPPIAAHLLSLTPEAAARLQGAGSHRPIAAHLRSMTPEAAARLKGAGSQPPKSPSHTDVNAAPAHSSLVSSGLSLATQTAEDLPWPLLRTTGAFQSEHAKIERALAIRTAELVAQLQADHAPPQAIAVGGRVTNRNLAGQLAVIARFNQPVSRAAKIPAKSVANRAYGKFSPAHADHSKRHGAGAKATHDVSVRPQALVIDLAAAKIKRRVEKARRAA